MSPRYGLTPHKKLGQNFITNPDIFRRIVNVAGDLTSSPIIEIGPGPGGLTKAILEAGALQVIAIEKDERCIPILDDIQTTYHGRFSYRIGDALSIPLKDVCGQPFKIIGNLPYNIATALIIKWLDDRPVSMTLMVQKEVALRLIARPHTSDYGRLSILVQWLYEVKKVFDIQPGSFFPPPKVVSSLVYLTPKDISPQDLRIRPFLEHLTQVVFSQRRKMLRTSLRSIISISELKEIRIDPQKRPQDLELEEFLTLAKVLQENAIHKGLQ